MTPLSLGVLFGGLYLLFNPRWNISPSTRRAFRSAGAFAVLFQVFYMLDFSDYRLLRGRWALMGAAVGLGAFAIVNFALERIESIQHSALENVKNKKRKSG